MMNKYWTRKQKEELQKREDEVAAEAAAYSDYRKSMENAVI